MQEMSKGLVSLGKCLTLLALFVMGFSSMAFGENEFQRELQRKSRLAVEEDVVGTWEMIYQKWGGMYLPSDSLFIAPYQRFQFFRDGYFKDIASKKPLDGTALAIWKSAPKTSTWTFRKPGFLSIVRSPTDRDIIAITLFTEDLEKPLRPDAPILKKGDLLLSYLDPKGRLWLQRYLRRLAEKP